jgi:hypothetical protein
MCEINKSGEAYYFFGGTKVGKKYIANWAEKANIQVNRTTSV